MTSPAKIVKNAKGQWEVRRNNEDNTLLGTFDHRAWCLLFLEALFGLCSEADVEIEPFANSERVTRCENSLAA